MPGQCKCAPVGDEGADPRWYEAWSALLDLHVEKSATYGEDEDRLANFTKLGAAAGQPPERYAVERLIEKAIRALHMIDADKSQEVAEYPDLASLALCAEALRIRGHEPSIAWAAVGARARARDYAQGVVSSWAAASRRCCE